MAQKNRLKLDFSLVTAEERKDFLEKYLQSEMFQQREPDEDELCTMADYLLWGKDEKGRNGKQNGLELKSKHGTWDDSPVDSLDQLMEQPMFNESALSALGTTQFRAKKEVFSREDALTQASPIVRDSFLAIFSQIDKLDFMTAQWDLNHGKRIKPIRAELIRRFSPEEIAAMQEKVTHWNQYKYLKMRHELVELRREQYTLRDSYQKTMFTQDDDAYSETVVPDFDVDIEVLPLGAMHGDDFVTTLLFRTLRGFAPEQYTESELALISERYWKKQQFAPSAHQTWVDFRELEHVYQLLAFWSELHDAAKEADTTSNLSALLKTLQFYIDQADLSDIHSEILDMKLRKVKNTDIAWHVNHKYNKTYTPNYISTIFRQRIIPRINEAAKEHEEIISNVFFPENFKVCLGCGANLLRSPENFTRKSRANDGFSARCKRCEKKARQGG